MRPADGERSAVVGFAGQFGVAARIVRAKLATLEWIRVADPAAGVADDFQFKAGATRHALQVKWSQYPGSFAWSALVNETGKDPALVTKLAEAWQRLRSDWAGPLVVHLRTNNYASNTSPPAGTPLASSVAEGPRNFAAFLARSFEPVRQQVAQGTRGWGDLAKQAEVREWSDAWDVLRQRSGLGDDDFVLFLDALTISFGAPTDDPLLRPEHEAADRELEMLAWTLQGIAADPARRVQLSREELLERLGWSHRLKYRHPHRFPVPAVYTANQAARYALETRLATLQGGYLALVGPAGSGKSTLLAGLGLQGRSAKYYAFVPDAPDPLSARGEADSFLHDLSLALEESGLYRSGHGNDLRGQRSVLLDQLDRAGRRWVDRGESTTIIVDGLDHVPREQNPTRSLLEELPAPSALPDGVFVVLGTQTTAILPAAIQAALDHEGRIVDLPPLSGYEVRQLANNTGPGRWLLPGQQDALVRASQGHPLALTYLLQELAVLERDEPDDAARRPLADALLADASSYGRDVEQRYRGYFRAVADDPEVLELLGAVARLRIPVDLGWLSTWVAPQPLTQFTRRTATFFRQDGDVLQFIHNSFRRFLADETARVAGSVDSARDRQLHTALADVCASSDNRWQLYRDEELAHRFLGGQHREVLRLATAKRLRAALLDLRPAATVRDDAHLALRAAAEVDDYSAYVRMLLFLNELRNRELVLKPEELAATVLRLRAPTEAMQHIVRGGQLRVSPGAALKHAAHLASEGRAEPAQQILRACGGLADLVDHAGPYAGHGTAQTVAEWAEATYYLSGLDEVLAQLDHHLPVSTPAIDVDEAADAGGAGADEESQERERQRREQRDGEATTAECRNMVHARCFDLLLDARDELALDAITQLIDQEAPADWRARARLLRAATALEDGAPAETTRWIGELADIENNALNETDEQDDELDPTDPADTQSPLSLAIRVRAAELLIRAGFADAPEIDRLVPTGTKAKWPSELSGSAGLAPFRTMLDLARLRVMRPDPASAPAPEAARNSPSLDVGKERFRRALHVVARLEGEQILASTSRTEPPLVAAHADTVIRLLEVPREQTRRWNSWYAVRSAASDLLRRLVELAARTNGSPGLTLLEEMFEAAWTTPGRAGYWSVETQQAVLTSALVGGSEATTWVQKWLHRLETEIDNRSYDPYDRVTNWLAQAQAWARIGETDRAARAAQTAVRASCGAGYNADSRQLSEWLEWLAAANHSGHVTHDEFLDAIRTYASRIAAAHSHASGEAESAGERLIPLTWRAAPSLACAIAESFCDAGILDEELAVQSVVLAATQDLAIPPMLAAVATAHLLLPILGRPCPEIEEALHARGGDIEGLAVIRDAAAVWTAPSRDDDSEEEIHTHTSAPATSDSDVPAPQNTPGALLTALRRTDDRANAPIGGWDAAVGRVLAQATPRATARSLLEQATRLRLDGAAVGGLAALAARSGEPDAAAEALVDILARTPSYGWIFHTDGGSRLKIFDAALRDRDPALVRLAAHDLAGAIATRALSSPMSAADLQRVATLVAGRDIVAAAWPDVTAHLDVYAPAGEPVPDKTHMAAPAASSVEAFARWVVGFLGHPVRPLDFGARRVLQVVLMLAPAAAQCVLAEAVAAHGWRAEAALLTLATALPAERPAHLSDDLTRAIQSAATGPDAISRDLAHRVGQIYRILVPEPAPRPLPSSYRLNLPPLLRRSAPELDAQGTPHLDLNDPQHLVAPFDIPLSWLAGPAGLDLSAILRRAASLAAANDEPWIKGGHRAQADRLKIRGQRHSYRPWAYMAGRRALGTVLAELLDGKALRTDSDPAYLLGLINEPLMRVEPRPLDPATPLPWRPPETPTYDVKGWSAETQAAAQACAAASSTAADYLLAEHSEWRWLEGSRPEEQRIVTCINRGEPPPSGTLLLPEPEAWESTNNSSQHYPDELNLAWSHQQFVVRGNELHTDARWSDWLALHPSLARHLGWTSNGVELFAWYGSDGLWRARTVRRAHGLPSRRSRAISASGEIWQVVLSETGHEELRTAFPEIIRTISVERTIAEDPEKSGAKETRQTGQAFLSETLP